MKKILRGIGVTVLLGCLLFALPVTAQSITKKISVYFNKIKVEVNGQKTQSDNILYNGTTYIPLREVSEILGKTVDFNNETKTVNIYEKDNNSTPNPTTPVKPPSKPNPPTTPEPTNPTPVVSNGSINGAKVGMTKLELLNTLGKPSREDPSIYGFTWYVYNNDYSKYLQVGLKNDKVVAVYSNSGSWKLKNSIKIGSTKDSVKSVLGQNLSSVTEGYYTYNLSSSDTNTLYHFDDNNYIYVFYDKHNDYKVTGSMIFSKSLPFKDIFYGNTKNLSTATWAKAMEKQLLDIANAFRVRMGLEAFNYDSKASKSAYLHSKDMADNNYFSHTNLQGQSPFDRMKAQGVKYRSAAENIAYGQRNAIFANHGLMNSSGHRKNLLGSYKNLGVGVYYNSSKNQTYYTQNFFTPYN